jgi:hypothetical protein
MLHTHILIYFASTGRTSSLNLGTLQKSNALSEIREKGYKGRPTSLFLHVSGLEEKIGKH